MDQLPPSASAGEARRTGKLGVTRRNLVAGAALIGSALTTRSAMAGILETEMKTSTKRETKKKTERRKKKISSGKDGRRDCALCFVAGTRILTPSGERDVADLREGDAVVTLAGKERVIKRIIRSSFARLSDGNWPQEVLPVRIRRNALDAETPKRDLFVSRYHALYIDGLLVQAAKLVNGRSIAFVAPPDLDQLDYLNIELDSHDVVFAEGMACETLLDDKSESTAVPFAPVVSFSGGREELQSRLRSALSPILDVRTPVDIIRDRLEERAECMLAA